MSKRAKLLILFSAIAVLAALGAGLGYLRQPLSYTDGTEAASPADDAQLEAAVQLVEAAELAIREQKYDVAQAKFQELQTRFGTTPADDTDFGAIAGEGLARLECLMARGDDFSAESAAEVQKLVLAAIQSKDRKALLGYASCQFELGICNSDFAERINPRTQLSDEFYAFLEKEMREPFAATSELEVPGDLVKPLTDGHEATLMFRPFDSRWKWVGLCADSALHQTSAWIKPQ